MNKQNLDISGYKFGHYVCDKEVDATPMTRLGYNHFRGWEVPENENPADKGMMVVYGMGTEDEYVSWSPLKQFEQGYTAVPPAYSDQLGARSTDCMVERNELEELLPTLTGLQKEAVKKRIYALSLLEQALDVEVAALLGTDVLSIEQVRNKVAFEHIQEMVDSLEYKFERVGDSTTTVCYAFLPNGFRVGHGDSACVDPANFDWELGCKYAQERAKANAIDELWKLEGYLLKWTGRTSDDL